MSLKDLTGRLARWSLELQAFPFMMQFRKGTENVVADTLSRSVEELSVTPEDLLGMETTEFDATGVTPFFAVFGQHMYLNGHQYKLARKLRSLPDHGITDLEARDKLAIIRSQVKEHLHKAYERSRQRYDQRARQLLLTPGQEVWRRNFVLSNFGKAFNAKFAKKFVKCRVVRGVGSNAYELEDLQGRSLGVFHSKDIRL
ncbi:hypothetical protein KR215_004380 [Drosophila sulfurigaster]|nr:hypothetical protein KR215_004380 [Drosophila sulfurigaster]